MTDKDLLKRRIDTYNNLISRLDRITSANYMHIVAGMRCTLKAMIDNNLAIIDSTQENPCEGCTNRKDCVTCENGELKETELSHSEVTKISDQDNPLSEDFKRFEEEYLEKEKDEILCVYDRHAGLMDGAKWQKEQDKETIELAEDHAMLAGMEKMKEQMMKDAVDGLYIYRNKYTKKNVLHGFDVTCEAVQRFKKGDKVKLIIIKED